MTRNLKGRCSSLLFYLSVLLMFGGIPAIAATPVQIETAIQNGINWLIPQQDPCGFWEDDMTGNRGGTTGFAVVKLEDRAIEQGYTSPFDPAYSYAGNVQSGLNYIFSIATIIPISMQPAGNPDTDGDGIGVFIASDGHHRTYETGIAMMAIAASRSPARVVNYPGSAVDGWTYKQVLEDMVDYLAFGQNDIGNSRGGWIYQENTQEVSDNSNSGYAVLGLGYAESPVYGFGCTIPAFVKSELNIWIDFIQNDVNGDAMDGGSGYMDPNDWVNCLKTGNLIFEMTFYGDSSVFARVRDAVDYLERTWNDPIRDPGWGNPAFGGTPEYQTMYCIMKGLEYAGINTIFVGGSPNDWYGEFADAIVNTQQIDGNWPGDIWGGSHLATGWALLTLEKSTPGQPKDIKNLKWSQPPIPIDPNSPMPTYCGWDEISYNKDYEDPNGAWKIVADDFYCLGPMPIDSIHWWGSHFDWENPEQPPPPENLPTDWWIGFWSNTYTIGAGTKADVLFLTDTTGSMSGYLNDFKTALGGVLTAINNAAPGLNIRYSVADYRNYTDGGNYQAFGVNLIQPFTSNTALVQFAINGMVAAGGADWAESHLTGMVNISSNWTTPAGPLGFNGRTGANKIIIWAGDAHGHILGDEPGSSGNPPLGYYQTLNATINALTAQGIIVFGLNATDCSSGINLPYGGLFNQTPQHQQADDITSATGGTLFCSVGSGGPSIEDAIVDAVVSANVYSSPEVLLHSFRLPTSRVQVAQVGMDYYYGYYPQDVCYQYYVDLEPNEIFWQDKYRDETLNDIFWLSIVALYPDPCEPPIHPWGWKTRPWSWEDDAVRFNVPYEPPVGSAIDPCTVEPIKDPYFDESFDVAFELDTDPNWVKWEQPFTDIRDWPHYEDEVSMAFEGEEPSTKYDQYPDLDYTGMDVLAGPLSVDANAQTVYEKFLADDFLCEMTGPITDIHLWGSYNEDMKFPDMNDMPWFSLVIYENLPPDMNYPYSRPGAVVWDAYIQPSVEMVFATAQESFYDPNPDQIIGMDWTVWRYDFDIEPADAFVQQEGNIYWLGVHHTFDLNGDGIVNLVDVLLLRSTWPGAFGWKTSLEHFEDDAVWTDVMTFPGDPHVVPSGEIWNELRYPLGHQFDGNSIDLAFEITTTAVEEEIIVADDWRCEVNTPVIAIAWWGSYLGYGFEACADPCLASWMTLPVSPDYFRLGIWTDMPADPCAPQSYSHPDQLVWQYDANNYTEVLVGYDKHPHGDANDPNVPNEPNEPVFRYSVRLPEDKWFIQDEPNGIYWLSVVAVYESRQPIYDWGWTNHSHMFMDNAVSGLPGMWYQLYDQTEKSEDMSFILFTWGGPICWTWPGQCHGDCYGNDLKVDIDDFYPFKDAFGSSYGDINYNPCADFDRDGDVDIDDFYIFKDSFIVTDVPGDCVPGGEWPP